MAKGDHVEVECEVVMERGEAVLIRAEGKDHWLPLSQVSEIHKDDGFVVVARWLAEKEGLV